MEVLILYLLKANACISVLYLIYWIFLRNTSSYKLNRGYFLIGLICSLVIPLVRIPSLFKGNPSIQINIMPYIPMAGIDDLELQTSNIFNNYLNIAMLTIMIGAIILLVRFCIQLISLAYTVKSSSQYLLKNEDLKIRQINRPVIPFSFLNTIYLNPAILSDAELEKIITHEQVHVNDGHTYDVLISEFLTIFFWYNPFSWLTKNEIKQNLEYIADQDVIKKGFNKQEYQMTILNLSTKVYCKLPVNHFSQIKFRNRFYKMNEASSTKRRLFAMYFSAVPLFMLLLFAFNNEHNKVQPSWHAHGVSDSKYGNMEIHINKDKTASIIGRDGIFVIRDVNDLVFTDYPDAVLLYQGRKYPLSKYKSIINPLRVKFLYAYFGDFAKTKFGVNKLNAVVTVEYK